MTVFAIYFLYMEPTFPMLQDRYLFNIKVMVMQVINIPLYGVGNPLFDSWPSPNFSLEIYCSIDIIYKLK